MAARTARAEPWRVVLPALVVFGVEAFGDTAGSELSVDHLGLESAAGFVVLMLSTLGLTFYGGLLERLVGAVERDRPAPPLTEVMRTLPYGRLLAADAVIWVIGAVASVALVIPGIIAATLLSLVGPIITMGETRIRDALRRSARLVAPHFLLVLCLITLPLAVEHEVETAVLYLIPHERLVLVFAGNLLMGLVFGTALGLVEVSLAERIINGAQGPGTRSNAPLPSSNSTPTLDEGGRHGRDDSRDGHAGSGTVAPTG